MTRRQQSPSPAVLVLLGGPGSGKGTHGLALANALGYRHLSSGEHLREHIRRATPLGRRAREAIGSGQLVSDKLAIELARSMLGSGADASGVVMDGYPRTLAQAEALETIVPALHFTVTLALYLQISDDEMLRRLSGRLTCRACGRTCHETSTPPVQAGVCDTCGGELFRRADDEPAIIRQRIAVFHRMVVPLLEFYRASGRLTNVAAGGRVREVSMRVIKAARGGPRSFGTGIE
jgi:adenylate kinase